MKLSNQQIDAIVSTLSRKATKKYQTEIAAYRKQQREKNLPKATKYLAAIKAIPLDLRINYNTEPTIDSIINQLFDENKAPVKEFCEESTRNKIILASIEAVDMAELEKTLNVKLT